MIYCLIGIGKLDLKPTVFGAALYRESRIIGIHLSRDDAKNYVLNNTKEISKSKNFEFLVIQAIRPGTDFTTIVSEETWFPILDNGIDTSENSWRPKDLEGLNQLLAKTI